MSYYVTLSIILHRITPSPPTKSFPTKSPRVELSGRLPIIFYGHEFPPLIIKSLLESNPLKPELLVGGLGGLS